MRVLVDPNAPPPVPFALRARGVASVCCLIFLLSSGGVLVARAWHDAALFAGVGIAVAVASAVMFALDAVRMPRHSATLLSQLPAEFRDPLLRSMRRSALVNLGIALAAVAVCSALLLMALRDVAA